MFTTRREVADRRSRMRLFKHTANVTLDLLKKFGWDIIDHPPYSPDVAPSSHMFLALKKHLGGKTFESDAEVQKEVNTWLREADGES
uniref:Histone-lysine N-methyltransferase SETMAR n=1 Tax=Anopheles quadriannulatus TaxID=34691 RepID=A0A182XPW1_ANOQN